jgi:hypothetical protein
MNTPITDAASLHTDAFDSPTKALEFARRLELDRAALMDACQRFVSLPGDYNTLMDAEYVFRDAKSALSAARANFPES